MAASHGLLCAARKFVRTAKISSRRGNILFGLSLHETGCAKSPTLVEGARILQLDCYEGPWVIGKVVSANKDLMVLEQVGANSTLTRP